jgi:hypothetical protein
MLDGHGVHLAILDRHCVVRWASPALRASRGADLIGGHCHEGLWRRRLDCKACDVARVIETGEPHRFWVPATRPGALGPRHLVVQVPLANEEVLEAIIDTGAPDETFPDFVFRERVLLHGLRYVPVGVLLLDDTMRVVAANPAVLEMLGLGEETIKGRTIDELLPAGSFPARGKRLAELLTRKSVFGDREIRIGHGANRRVVLASLAAVMGRNHTFSAAVAILTDITRERALNEALARKVGELTLLQEIGQVLARTVRLEQVLRVILAAIVHPAGLGMGTAALFLVDEAEGRLKGRLARLRPNDPRRASVDVLGLELETLAFSETSAADRVLATLVGRVNVDLGRREHPLVMALHRDKPVLIRAGGEEDVADPRLTSIVGAGPLFLAALQSQGKRLGVLLGAAGPGAPPLDEDRLALAGTVANAAAGAIARSRLHDELENRLSDLREAHGRLRHLQGELLKEERLSTLGELAAEIVHQIRNPLAVVGGFSKRLLDSIDGDDPRQADVRILVEESQRMQGILERIRQDVRLSRVPSKGHVDPHELVGAALSRYHELALEHSVQLTADVDSELPTVQGNREILLEVLDNLLRNAFDAVESGGRVRLSARQFREAVHIVVEDDGIGLTNEQLERVFEPSYTTKVGGTGLGLPLSRRLVAQCGGTLTADGRPGEGARFRIVLKVLQADIADDPESVTEE